jgi:hypothetical protein
MASDDMPPMQPMPMEAAGSTSGRPEGWRGSILARYPRHDVERAAAQFEELCEQSIAIAIAFGFFRIILAPLLLLLRFFGVDRLYAADDAVDLSRYDADDTTRWATPSSWSLFSRLGGRMPKPRVRPGNRHWGRPSRKAALLASRRHMPPKLGPENAVCDPPLYVHDEGSRVFIVGARPPPSVERPRPKRAPVHTWPPRRVARRRAPRHRVARPVRVAGETQAGSGDDGPPPPEPPAHDPLLIGGAS